MHELPPSLIASHFINDPRLQKAKKIILDTLQGYQKEIKTIRPPTEKLAQTYEDLINKFSEIRGGKLYFPFIGSGMGNGALVELLDGSIKYDMISGIGVHYFGHHHPEIISTSLVSALSDTIMQGHLQQNIDSLDLCELLTKASGMDHCFLSSSGAMANENALKIAFQKKTPAYRVLAFERCFTGRTLAMAQITDKPSYREGLPHILSVDYIPFYDPNKPEESTQLALTILKKHLSHYPKQHAAMIMELIQGEAGFYPGTREFFLSIIQLLREHSITVIIDEIQTFGRTESLFAFQYFNLQEFVDIVTIGKLSQVCATLFKNEYKPKPGLLSQTFTGSTSAIHASYYIINKLLNDNYLGKKGKIARIHDQFEKKFKKIEKRHPHLIQGPYGIGGMIAFTPLSGEFAEVAKFIQKLFQAGVISFFAGHHPTRVRFLVPIGGITEADIEHVTEILERVLLECYKLKE